jgi:hypothetical protein
MSEFDFIERAPRLSGIGVMTLEHEVGAMLARKPRPSRRKKAQDAVRALFEQGCDAPEEARARLSGQSFSAVRHAAVDRLTEARVDPYDYDTAEALLSATGVGDEWARVVGIVTDPARPMGLRARLWAVLEREDAEAADRATIGLPEEARVHMQEAPIRRLIAYAALYPELVEEVAELLAEVHGARRDAQVACVEVIRREVGTPALQLYGPLLADERFAAHRPRFIDALVADEDPRVDALLQARQAAAPEELERRQLHKAIMRRASHRIEAGPKAAEAPRVDAWLSDCDAEGVAHLFMLVARGPYMVDMMRLDLSADGDLREGRLALCVEPEFARRVLQRGGSGGHVSWTAIPAGQAATLIHRSVTACHAADRHLPGLITEVLGRLDRLGVEPAPLPDHEIGEPCPPYPQIMRERLSCPGSPEWYLGAPPASGLWPWPNPFLDAPAEIGGRRMWHIPPGDLEALGVRKPPPKRASRKWRVDAAESLRDRAPLARLAAMCRLEGYRSSARRGADFARYAHELETAPADSLFLHVILERSAEAWRMADAGLPVPQGAPGFRALLRTRLRVDGGAPGGKDLARLDVLEVLARVTIEALPFVPIAARPRPELLREILPAAARRVVRYLRANELHPRQACIVERLIEEELAPAGPGFLSSVLEPLSAAVMTFTLEVCARCPVACLRREPRDAARHFVADRHPAPLHGVSLGLRPRRLGARASVSSAT